MKTIRILGLILSVVTFVTVIGCKHSDPIVKVEKEVVYQDRVTEVIKEVTGTPETIMPLTPVILQRLRDSGEEADISERITKYQFLLFGRINLEREYIEYNDGLLDGGTAKFENVRTRENIIINDQTEGQVISYRATRNETTLHLCFENDNNLQLVFYAEGTSPDEFFYLNYTESYGPGDEKGTLMYGGELYKLKYNDRRPYILIKLSQRDIERIESRTASGRKVVY